MDVRYLFEIVQLHFFAYRLKNIGRKKAQRGEADNEEGDDIALVVRNVLQERFATKKGEVIPRMSALATKEKSTVL